MRGRNSKASIPALLPLLKDSRAWKRYIATFTVVALAAEGVQDHLLLLIDDADARVRMYALLSLGMHCDPEQLPVFQARFDQSLSEGVMYGIGRCGNAASFATLQPLLGAPDSGVRHRANHALRLLTFTDMNSREIPSRGYPEDWEAWYRRYGRQSRDQWALRRLKERDETQNEFGKRHALDYFFRSRDPRWLPELRRAASSRRYGVRIAAARGVLPFERAEGLSLLRRELNNRQLGACQSAAEALNRATGQQIEFDFTLPSERTRAVVAYARVR